MSLSAHFKKSPVPAPDEDGAGTGISWLSITPTNIPTAQRPKQAQSEKKSPSEPTDIIPSRGISTYLKNARFNAYQSTRPALLQEINVMIEHDSKNLHRKFGDSIPKSSLLESYSAAFSRYVEESTLYKPFLREVKRRYDEAISDCSERSKRYDELDVMLKARDESHQNQLKDALEEANKLKIELELKLETAREQAKTTAASLSKLNSENSKLQETNHQLRKDLDASKVTTGLLSAQLARLAEDKLRSDAQESAHLLELAQLRKLETTLNIERDRLNEAIAERDATHASLVSADVLAGVQADLDAARSENERILSIHRQLLVRYSAVKFMIDGSFKKIDAAKVIQSEEPHIGRAKAQSKVMEILNDYNFAIENVRKKEALRLKEPTEKVLELVAESSYPKVIFECLLDQIERLYIEKRRLLYGDETGPIDEEINELGDIAEDEQADAVFQGLGYGDNVPSYLRYEGTIRNIKISLRTTIDLVHEICCAKAAHEALGIEPASIILPVAREAIHVSTEESKNRERSKDQDSDSDLDSIDSHVNRRASGDTLSPPHSPSAHTSKLFNSLRGQNCKGAQQQGRLNSIDSEAESYIPSLPVLPSNCSMAEFFECFLKDKVCDAVAAVELAYNIIDALRRYSHLHSDCCLFNSLLAGEVHFSVWLDRCSMVEKLRSALQKENATNTRAADGEWKLTPEKFFKVVKKVLNTRTEEEFTALKDVLISEHKTESRYVNGTLMLFDGEDGEESLFIKLVKAQHLEDCISMEKNVMACVEQLCEPGVVEVPIGKLREALLQADKNKTRLEVNLLLARGARCTLEAILLKEAKHIPVSLEEFKIDIKNGLLKKSPTKKPKQ